jgi:hypothetical protein
MDRAFMLEFINDNRTKPWLKHRELKELDSDPSVLDMIKAIPPLMGPLQEKLDKAFYPNVAEDAATVRELIGRFQGRRPCTFCRPALALLDVSWRRRSHLLHPACCTSPTPMSPMTATPTTTQLSPLVTTRASSSLASTQNNRGQ